MRYSPLATALDHDDTVEYSDADLRTQWPVEYGMLTRPRTHREHSATRLTVTNLRNGKRHLVSHRFVVPVFDVDAALFRTLPVASAATRGPHPGGNAWAPSPVKAQAGGAAAATPRRQQPSVKAHTCPYVSTATGKSVAQVLVRAAFMYVVRMQPATTVRGGSRTVRRASVVAPPPTLSPPAHSPSLGLATVC